MKLSDVTAPVGYDDNGQPIETVTVTASKIPQMIPGGLLLALLAVVLAGVFRSDKPFH